MKTLTTVKLLTILAFMLTVGGFPAGPTELPRETELLKQIAFEASRSVK